MKKVYIQNFDDAINSGNLSSESYVQEIIDHYLLIIELLSQRSAESTYVVNLIEERFLYVSNHDLFLSGRSSSDILEIGYEYYDNIIHPEDLQLFYSMQQIIREYLFHPETEIENIDCFACNFRIINHGLTLMVYQKLIPVIVHGRPLMAICTMSSSVIKTSGGLTIYYKNRKICASYSFKNKQWKEKKVLKLTKREKEIIKLSQQGKQNKEISHMLGISDKTIQNLRRELYRKLNQHSILEAVILATNHHLIFMQ